MQKSLFLNENHMQHFQMSQNESFNYNYYNETPACTHKFFYCEKSNHFLKKKCYNLILYVVFIIAGV